MTLILMKNFRACDQRICDIANSLGPKTYTSREFINEMGKYLKKFKKERLLD